MPKHNRPGRLTSTLERARERKQVAGSIAYNAAARTLGAANVDCLGLWAAVMRRAYEDLAGPSADTVRAARSGVEKALDLEQEERMNRRASMRWFASDSEEIGTLLWCCKHLELEPAAVREHALLAYAMNGSCGAAAA